MFYIIIIHVFQFHEHQVQSIKHQYSFAYNSILQYLYNTFGSKQRTVANVYLFVCSVSSFLYFRKKNKAPMECKKDAHSTGRHNVIHYGDVIMSMIASQITSLTIVYSTVYSDADQRKHQSSASLAFVLGIHRGPVNSPHKWPVTRKMFPFDDVIMSYRNKRSDTIGSSL